MQTFANGDAISTVYPPRSYRPAIRIWTLLATEYFPPVRLLARRSPAHDSAPGTRSSVPKDKMRRQIIPDVLGGCSCAVSTIRCRSVKFLNNFRQGRDQFCLPYHRLHWQKPRKVWKTCPRWRTAVPKLFEGARQTFQSYLKLSEIESGQNAATSDWPRIFLHPLNSRFEMKLRLKQHPPLKSPTAWVQKRTDSLYGLLAAPHGPKQPERVSCPWTRPIQVGLGTITRMVSLAAVSVKYRQQTGRSRVRILKTRGRFFSLHFILLPLSPFIVFRCFSINHSFVHSLIHSFLPSASHSLITHSVVQSVSASGLQSLS